MRGDVGAVLDTRCEKQELRDKKNIHPQIIKYTNQPQ
jgi:hypothetical protein